MLSIVNRVLLGLLGLALFGAGLVVVLTALDVVPAAWPWSGPDDVLLSDADRTRWRDEGWWWPVVIGGLALVMLLALWWTVAQLRQQRLSEVLVDSGDGVGALLRGRAMEDVVSAEAESLPGIDEARVTLVGRRTQPRIRVGLLLAPQAQPDVAVHRLRTEAVEHARASAGLAVLPTEVRLRSTKHAPERLS
ncbi:alkaline shock response membrane anchor protein AmaP [Streptomyces hainanensis]|uniref:Alkaline shock response membrane anchor protein AmaP n=1 Tax=Streptomyces hainanensis TaxID=402648 RepID=A0A4R4TAN6_9ACTN|nr:alkaline shock response membrane anchor protein AmaP [Streptomyces hainanensis]TDC72202.1 alkaline shock response membrane anchor protein AmaP [Streptomyces hainanensis]